MTKKLSGAQQRRQRRERLAAELADDAQRLAAGVDYAGELAALGPPPVDANELLLWARRLAANAAWQAMRDPALTAVARWRIVADLVGRLGLTHAKSLIDRDLRSVRERLGRADRNRAERHVAPTASLAKPPTARGAAKPEEPQS